MIGLNIIMRGDGAWPDLSGKKVVEATQIEVARLTGGMQSGKSSVTIRLNLPDGSVVLAQTSMALFLNAARAFKVAEEQSN